MGYRVCMTIDFQNALISRIFRVFLTEQAAYHFSVCLRSNICFSLRLWQIIDRRDTDKLRYFAITEFINCFIIRSPFFRFIKDAKSLSACSGNRSAIFTQERSFNYA